MSLIGRSVIVTGASRGVGRAIACRFAQEGANITLMAKTVDEQTCKLAGTLLETQEIINSADWKHKDTNCKIVHLDLRSRDSIKTSVNEVVKSFGGIDMLVNNASALEKSKDTVDLSERKFDLLNQINTCGTFMMTKEALPHLLKSNQARVLTLSPPINLNPEWFSLGGTAYTVSKYNMSLFTLGWSKEYAGKVAFNALWPLHGIKSAATHRLLGNFGLAHCHPPELLAEAAFQAMNKEVEFTGNCLVDEYFLEVQGIDITKWTATTRSPIVPDLYVGEPSNVMKIMKLAHLLF